MNRIGLDRKPGRREGAALVLCMVMTATIMTGITIISMRTVAHVRYSQYAAWHAEAMADAEVVLSAVRDAMEMGGPGTIGYSGDQAAVLASRVAPPSMTSPEVSPQFLEGAPELRWYSIAGTPEGYHEDIVVILAVAEVRGVNAAVEGAFRRAASDGRLQRITWRERVVQARRATP